MTPKRRVFFSFHYQADAWRAAQIRNIGALEHDEPLSDNDWETVKRGGARAIQYWIDRQIQGKSCAVVLIGAGTASRKWVQYEIIKAWNERKGVVAIHIHNLKNREGLQSHKGENPLSQITVGSRRLSDISPTWDPPSQISTDVYAFISKHIAGMIEHGINIRNNN